MKDKKRNFNKDGVKNQGITRREDNYSQWYLDIIERAGLADNSPVRGCMIIKPYGYAIWENVQKTLDGMFKATGVENAYFPLLIPVSFLSKEAEHVKGFAKECAVVTHHRLEADPQGGLRPAAKLEEPLVIRPTSETIMYDAYSKWIQSYRDLPLLINQWANIVRWEMRTRPFLRTTEFLWQEGHTAHATKKEAADRTKQMIYVYKDFVENFMAIPVILGVKTELEKFPGADYTISIEAMMQDGKALQVGTSHMLGQNFAKTFDIKFLAKDGKTKYVWQTSWGASTRLIGALIMVHSDDRGLILPPKLAPWPVVIVPIWSSDKERSSVLSQVNNFVDKFKKESSINVKVDDREMRPGPRFYEWERKGVPLRIEIGPKDVADKSFVAVRRDNGEKETVKNSELISYIKDTLEDIQKSLFTKALKFRNDNTRKVDVYKEFKEIIKNKPGFILAHWCGNAKCEEKIQAETKATIRCISFDQKKEKGQCILCGKNSTGRVIFAKAY